LGGAVMALIPLILFEKLFAKVDSPVII